MEVRKTKKTYFNVFFVSNFRRICRRKLTRLKSNRRKLFYTILTLYLIYELLEVYIDRHTDYGTVKGWDENTSRSVSAYIKPKNTTTVILPDNFCTSHTYILIIVNSSPEHIARRNVIRETWASTYNNVKFPVVIYFLVGQVQNVTLQEQIELEFLRWNDIIQEHFIDSYNNLTIKSLMMLKLVHGHCMNTTRYLMKADDDVYVQILSLVNYLKAYGRRDLLVGCLMQDPVPIRDPHNKWNTPRYLYSKSTYPPFLSGTGYVMSIDVVHRLYKASFHVEILYLEDVYITGLVPESIKLTPINNRRFSWSKRRLDPCLFRRAITSHGLNNMEMKELYDVIRKGDVRRCMKRVPDFFNLAEMILKLIHLPARIRRRIVRGIGSFFD